jgi:transposase-like protein
VDHRRKETLWAEHIDGTPFRKLGTQKEISQTKAYRQVEMEMDLLPDNSYVSATYCNRWFNILNLDGKYVKIRGYQKKIPFVYGIDFHTHDIPVGMLVPSENYQAFLKYLRTLKAIGYIPSVVVCDDVSALKPALAMVFPKAKIQLCHTHYLENIRRQLCIRTNEKYKPFFYALCAAFRTKLPSERERRLHEAGEHIQGNPILLEIMRDIHFRKVELFMYQSIKNCPRTNNMIESFNSHLQGRLKTIKGFDSFHSAERWLNAWMIRRRTSNFTDCDHPFKHLNGKCSLGETIKKDLNYDDILKKIIVSKG